MSVAVESHQPRRAPGEGPPRFAFGEREQTQPSRHTLGESLASGRRREFLAMVLHELKNPLSSILAGVAFARDTEQLPPDSEWVWTGLENATRKVECLLADLMELCQASHPTFRLRKRPMDLASAVCVVAGRRVRRRRPRRSSLRGSELKAEAVWVAADPDRLELVLGNLLDNAAKYSEPGGQVTVALEATHVEVVLRVRDTGIGIALAVLPFVFDAFVREGISGGRPRRGSGVGLLLVRTLVELHGGRAEASSAGPGRGSEFVVRLPVTGWDLM